MITSAAVVQGALASFGQLRGLATRLFDTGATQAPRPASDRAVDAEQLRAFARDFVESDPAFADDLFAAADRHERGC
ncbi:MAG TPA: hypothetical protein VMG60_20860 [Burkholderiaceae bacterium]|nr:hypothetical protein [Burkholderiaceae bacterium]